MRWLLTRAVRVFFRRIEVAGLDNVPSQGEGGVIFCGNHPNSLLDPVLITTQCGRIVHFAAKDVLWSSRLLRVFLDALGAVPVRRKMDHKEGPLDNDSMFAALHRVLSEGRAVGIFPEGISHDESQLAPLKTGAARIALGAKREYPNSRIVIVPTGLCYFTRNRFRSSVLVQFGAPIEITTEMANAPDQPEMVRQLTKTIDSRMRGLTINAESWEQIRVLDAVRRLYQPEGISLEDRVELARRFNEVYPRVKDQPEVRELVDRVGEYVVRLSAVGLKDEALVRRPSAGETALAIGEHLTLLFMSLPLFVIGAPLHLPLGLLFKMTRYFAPRKDVIATTKFLVGLLTMLLVYIALAVGVGWLFGVWWGLLTAVVLPLSGRACVHVLSRVDALRHMVLTSARVMMLGKEVERLRTQRAQLVAQTISMVERHRPADMPALFPGSRFDLKPAVVFLHGLARTHRSMAGLRRHVARRGFDTWSQSYPSRRMSLSDLAASMAARIRDDLGDRPIIGVTHSLGGILARHMGELLTWEGVVMLAPPNSGSRVAAALADHPLLRWYFGPAGRALGRPDAWPDPPAPFAIIAGTRGATIGNLPSWMIRALHLIPPNTPSDGTVTVDETRLPGMASFAEVDASHTWMMNHPTAQELVLHFLQNRRFPR